MADHPNVDAARASLEAFMKGDVEGFAAGLADDSIWHIPGTPSSSCTCAKGCSASSGR